MRITILLALAAVVSLNVACSSPPAVAAADIAAKPPHHREQGFQNNHLNFQPRGLSELLTWQWQALREGLPKPPARPTPRVEPDLDFIRANAAAGAAMQPAMTWIGHATVLVQMGGLNVLTDPIFSERASPVSFAGPRRALPPGLALAQLPRIDAVVISHNHYDHLDEASVVALSQQPGGSPLFLVPLGNKAWFEAVGVPRVMELDWWQTHRLGGVDITITPVQHWSGRSLTDRLKTLWGGWALVASDFSLFFAGDTGYSKDFADIGQRLAAPRGGFDIALIPVGAYEPRWFMTEQHVNPAEAVQMHRDLQARRSLGIHWGTFELTDESLDEPPRALAAARQAAGLTDDDFFVLAVGQTRKLPRRSR
jgi:N-acyl-phosphatidylethanolamine-hydrolysing phospholipase D